MKTDITKRIADLLPGDLTEDTVAQIATLFEEKISEEIKSEVDRLTIKFNSLLRANVDSLKEQALVELEEENETYRKAQLFETVENIMAVELADPDKDRAIAVMAEETASTNQEVEVLVNEVDRLMEENKTLVRTVKILDSKVDILSEQNQDLTEEISEIDESTEAFHSSEKALMITEADKEAKIQPSVENEFLTEEVINLTL